MKCVTQFAQRFRAIAQAELNLCVRLFEITNFVFGVSIKVLQNKRLKQPTDDNCMKNEGRVLQWSWAFPDEILKM